MFITVPVATVLLQVVAPQDPQRLRSSSASAVWKGTAVHRRTGGGGEVVKRPSSQSIITVVALIIVYMMCVYNNNVLAPTG